ncbi:MAG: hypothetical protein IT174_14565 [Acidobacteria bacterium]|nr:hypothetical protein [Acidobacteriota bacterium]
MINWLAKDAYRQDVDRLLERGMVNYFDICVFKLDRKTIQDFTGANVEVETAEFAEPGPFSRWYGFDLQTPIQLTHFEAGDGLTLLTAGLETRPIFSWKMVREFDLSSAFITGLKWITGKPDASVSVFAREARGIVLELYRAESESDAIEFQDFLRSAGYLKELIIDRSDILSWQWIVRAKEKEIGRYTSRYDAQLFGALKSEQHEGIVDVFAEEVYSTCAQKRHKLNPKR